MDSLQFLHTRPSFTRPEPVFTTSSHSFKSRVLILILILSVFKCLLAFLLELGNDEAYYWLYSQDLQWNYFDHPPLVAVWIRLFTANLALESSEGFIRLGSILGCALATWFLYKTAAALHSERAGWFAAVLYNSSFYAGITSGLYILPDTPQMVFWTLSLWMIARITKRPDNWIYWLIFGLSAGLAIMSKVHGLFLWAGMGAYMLILKRSWFSKPQPYVAFLLTLLIISPVLVWNWRYDFVTYRFHSSRVTVNVFTVRWRSFLREAGSQLCFNNPVNVVLSLSSLFAWSKNRAKWPAALSIYVFIGLPLALVLLLISLFRTTTLPHWSGPAYISLIPLAAIRLAEIHPGKFPMLLRWALGLFIAILTGWVLLVQYYPGTYGKQGANLGSGDISLDMYGWREAGKEFQSIYRRDLAKKLMPAGSPLVSSYWWGAHVEYYFGRPLGIPLMGLGSMNQVHQYVWLNQLRKDGINMDQAYCIIPSDEHNRVPLDYYSSGELAGVIRIGRGSKPAHEFYVYRLRGFRNQLPGIR